MLILQIQRREVESHLQAAMRLHLDLACVKLSDTQRKFEKLEKRVNSLENHIHYSEENCESFTWRIDSFSEVMRKAKSGEEIRIDSNPFYRYGYKCKLRLYPDGEGAFKNIDNMLVYLIIMKGELDAILSWPFHKKVTFTLIDQQENANDRENIVKSVISDSKSGSFKRPVEKENFGWGFAKFVSHEKLQERRYIVDDAIFIQFHITSPE